MSPNVLVTGAAGFLGSHLCEALVRQGNHVVGVDNFFRGKRENLRALDGSSAFELHDLDLANRSNQDMLADLIRSRRPAQVFHHAAINGTRYFYEMSLGVLRQNIEMTSNLLDALAQGGFGGKVVYASSSEVYGDPYVIPTPETHFAVLRPGMDRDGYAISKVVAEMQVRLTAAANGWDWVVLRIFNCYGPRMDSSKYGQVIPEFIRKVTASEAFTIIGDGHQTRSFCFVGDMVWQTLECAARATQDVVNVGNDTEVEIAEVARRVHDLAARQFEPAYIPAWPGDHKRRCPSLTKLRALVGDMLLTDLEEGLAETYDYYAGRHERSQV